MKKKYLSILLFVTLFLIIIVFLLKSDDILTNTMLYSNLFYNKVFPSAIIFYTLSNIILEYDFIGLIFNIFKINSSSIFIFVLSLISGFPSGSKYTSTLLNKGIIDKNSANNIIMFSHFPNPLFILGSVSSVLSGNKRLALYILISIIISNFIIMMFSKSNSININYSSNKSFIKVLTNSIIISFKTILIVYGTSLLFYLISTLISKYISNSVLYVLFSGLFDLTNGIFSCQFLSNIYLRCIFIILFTCFGSLSIHFQVLEFINNTEIKYLSFIKGRYISTIISIIIFSLLFLLY